MKIKWTWALFVPFFIVMTGLKVYQTVFLPKGGEFLGMNNTQLTYFIVILGVALFLLCAILNILDKKTADIIPPSRGIVTGLLSILVAASIVLYSGFDIYGMYLNRSYAVLWLISGVLGFLAAISLTVGAIAQFSGKNISRGISLLFMLPAMWSASQLIATFSQFTWLSVRSNDMTVIVAYAFQSMFLFYYAAVMISYNDKNAVKTNLVYGLPAVCLLAVCGISVTVNMLTIPEMFTLEGILLDAQLIVMALFILSFLITASRHLITKDQVNETESKQKDEADELTEEEQSSFRSVTDRLEEDEEDSSFTLTSAPVQEEQTAPEQNRGSFNEASDMLNKLLEDLD